MSDRALLIFISIYCAIKIMVWILGLIVDIFEGVKEAKEERSRPPKPKRKTFHELLDERMAQRKTSRNDQI